MKKAIVIGASSGLGRQVALLLLEKGWQVGLAARRTALLESIHADFPDRTMTAAIDVTAEDAGQRLALLIGETGGMDLFFYAAGIGKQNPQLEETTEIDTVRTNALGFTRMIGAAYRYMAAHGGGHIAVITSIAGTKGLGPAPSYSATKALQNTYLEALEQQARQRRLPIVFTDIRPGFVDTDLLHAADGRLSRHYPLLLRPEAVARDIVKAVEKRRHVRVIDWRWRIITALWRRIPRFVWRRVNLVES